MRGALLLSDDERAERQLSMANDAQAPDPHCGRSTALERSRACRPLSAEVSRQPIGRSLNGFRPVLQRVHREPPDRSRDADRSYDLTGKVPDRHGDTTHLQVELAVVEGDAGSPDLLDLAQEDRHLSYRSLGRRLEVRPCEEALELVGLQGCENDFAQG